MSIFRFDCVFYYVSDLDRAVGFYATVLGLPLSSRDVVARFDAGGVLLELVPTPDPALPGGRGNARVALAVDDIEAAVRWLAAAGVATSPIREVANGRLASLADPDGNEIVVWQGSR